jgi:hypothetical protein
MPHFPTTTVLFCVLCLASCRPFLPHPCPPSEIIEGQTRQIPVAGLTLVAPPDSFTRNPVIEMQSVGASWVAVVPYGFTRKGEPKVYFNLPRQWWGERTEGIVTSIAAAHAHGVKVLLKPQVYVPNGWTGGLDFERNADWELWEADYEKYILEMASLAEAEKVELFCVGTEFKTAIAARPKFWTALIEKVRAVYSGQLTYAANWDEYTETPFWEALDFIGVNAYFPLLDDKQPSKTALIQAWQPSLEAIAALQCRHNKPVLFTEFGYLSVEGCTGKTWELEQKVHQLPINEAAQATALSALFTVFAAQDWWHGGFLWKWFPEMQGHEGYPQKDYTPQGKQAEMVLKQWWGEGMKSKK